MTDTITPLSSVLTFIFTPGGQLDNMCISLLATSLLGQFRVGLDQRKVVISDTGLKCCISQFYYFEPLLRFLA